MKNKVLVKINFPELSISFELFIPVNEVIWKIRTLIFKAVQEIYALKNINKNVYLINKQTGQLYDNNLIILDTDIRNGTELLIVSYEKTKI